MPTPLQPFLYLAEQLYQGTLPEADLPLVSTNLPKLDQETLNALTERAQTASLTTPRLGWAIAAVADRAARDTDDVHLHSLAAFHIARAANDWVRPDQVAEAVGRARTGFEALNDWGWVAACEWQLYALPWTRNDFKQAAEKLTAALDDLQRAGLTEWVPHCQLSLAYAHLLRGEYAEVQKYLLQSEQIFSDQGDALHCARVWLHDASRLRRQGHLGEMYARLQQALKTFQTLSASVDIAKTHFQIGHYALLSGDYPEAEKHFLTTLETFTECDLSLWMGQCHGALAQVYNNIGRPGKAIESLEKAGEIYAQFEVVGLRADNLLDQSRQLMLRADYSKSLELLQRAEAGYEQVGATQMVAVAALYQGEACLSLSRFQRALHHLERSQAQFQKVDEPYRLAESDLYLAQAWLALGNWDSARTHLEKAIAYFRQAGHHAYLAQALNQLGLGFLEHGKYAQALSVLEEALALSQRYQIDIQAITAQKYLGEILSLMNCHEEACLHLEQAFAFARQAELLASQIPCLISLAEGYARAGTPENAKAAWIEAITLGKETIPGIAWQAHAGLGFLTMQAGHPRTALEEFRQAMSALSELRRDFWQPHLADSYLQRTVSYLDQAIYLAAEYGTGEDLLTFIEASKAQTLARQLTAPREKRPIPDVQELFLLKGEIHLLLEKLRTSSNEPILVQRARRKDLNLELREKNQAYHRLQSRLERQHKADDIPDNIFALSHFRASLTAHLGENWVALDYYLSETKVYGVLLTHTECQPWQTAISPQARQSLEIMQHAQGKFREYTFTDLETLGIILFPEMLNPLLHPDTTLILAPHRGLNKVPWAALPLFLRDGSDSPLVTQCIPLLIPSLHSLYLLYTRRGSPPTLPGQMKGLALAVSTFQGRHPDLPQVLEEVAHLRGRAGTSLNVLSEMEATWQKLREFVQRVPLASLNYFHLATHAFHDPLTGRMAGLALFDQDIWLDQLWDLAPLPPLVTLSACYGMQSRVYEGDEHMGLTVTCLAAHADHIVGSLWPVLDESSATLMVTFYGHYLSGEGIARALAFAQREMWVRSLPGWESFTCVGLP